MKKKIGFLFLIFILSLPVLPKFHPEIKWREISKHNLIVIFPKGYEKDARYTLHTAEKIYQELNDIWRIPVDDKIRILLTDVYDFANGNATVFPFNQITIFLYNSPPDSVLGNCHEWLSLVLSHEMSHIISLNAGSKKIRFLRTLFGHHPFLYPINFSPTWMIEGLAIYGESKLNPGGRFNSPDYSIILENLARAKSIPKRRDISGEPTCWPGAESKYLFGSKFIQFLIGKFGEKKIPELVNHYAKYLITISSSHRYFQFFQKNLSQLWQEFSDTIKVEENHNMEKMNILTHCGMLKKFPLVIDQNRGIYFFKNYLDYPGIWEIDLKTSQKKKLLKQANINAMSYSSEDQKIYFSAWEYFRSYYQFSDIFEFSFKTNQKKRLSQGKRLSSPVKLPGTQKIYCVKRKNNKSHIAVFDLKENREKIISQGFNGISFLAISPNKQYIAASLQQTKKKWTIALFNLKGELIKILGDNDKKNYYPQWKNNQELFFITENNSNYRLAMHNLNSNETFIINGRELPPIQYFSFLPDQNQILTVYFNSNGYDLGQVEIFDLKRETLAFEKKISDPDMESDYSQIKSRKYNIWRDLSPKYISFNFRYAGNEIQPGIILSGTDALSRHYITFQGFYGFITETKNFTLNYTYDGLYPTLTLNLMNYTDLNQNENQENYLYSIKKIELISIYPLYYSENNQSHFYTDIHFENITEDYYEFDEQFQLRLNGFKIGFLYNSAKRYYDSFSQADGISFSLSYSRDFKFLGSDFDLNTLAFEYKQYLALLRPNVLAIRFGICDSWGEGKRIYYMGGAVSKNDNHIAGENIFNLMRGYPSGHFPGTGGFLFNLEYRLTLAKMEKTIFVSNRIERFFVSFFLDIGNMWEEEKTINPAYSIGTELSMVLFLGRRVTLSGGVAIGRNPTSEPIFYLRIGESF